MENTGFASRTSASSDYRSPRQSARVAQGPAPDAPDAPDAGRAGGAAGAGRPGPLRPGAATAVAARSTTNDRRARRRGAIRRRCSGAWPARRAALSDAAAKSSWMTHRPRRCGKARPVLRRRSGIRGPSAAARSPTRCARLSAAPVRRRSESGGMRMRTSGERSDTLELA